MKFAIEGAEVSLPNIGNLDIDLYVRQYWDTSFLQSCEQEGYFEKEDSKYIAIKIVIGLRRMYPRYNFNCRKYTVLTIEELGRCYNYNITSAIVYFLLIISPEEANSQYKKRESILSNKLS